MARKVTASKNGRPPTKLSDLEQRLSALERQVAELKAAPAASAPGPHDWQRTIGMFTGDEVMKRIDAAALEYREADRRKARRQWARRKARRGKQTAGRAR